MTRLRQKIYRKNKATQGLLLDLLAKTRETGQPVWKTLAEHLAAPTRQQRRVNLDELNGYTDEHILVVPGKVLGSGRLKAEGLTVAAHKFSDSAQQAINETGQALSIEELLENAEKPLRIIG
jgi:large subunit ribosomal protein L18e